MPKSFPLVPKENLLGNVSSYSKSPINFYSKWEKELGDTFYFSILNRKVLYTSNLDTVKFILQENNKNYRKNLAYRKLKLLLGDGLFTSEGEYWLRQRRQLQNFFYKDKLNDYFFQFESITQKCISEANNEENLLPFLTKLTLKIISKTVLNLESESSKVIEENLPFALRFMINRITNPPNAPIWIPTSNNQLFKKSVKSIDQYLSQLIQERETDGNQSDVLSLFVQLREQGFEITDQQIRDELMTMFLAGQETTAVSAFWLIKNICSNDDVLKDIRIEFKKVLGNDSFSPSHIRDLTFTKAVIDETLRIASPVWVVGRESLNSDNFGEYSIPKEQSVIFSPYMIHRKEQYWQNPEFFSPDRFNKEYEKTAYLPFGTGPRICIGNNFSIMELFVFINEFFVKRDLKIDNAKQKVDYEFSLTLRPKSDLKFMI